MSILKELLEEEKRIKIQLEEEKRKIQELLAKKRNEVKVKLDEFEKELVLKTQLEEKKEEEELRSFFEKRLDKLRAFNNSLKALDDEVFLNIVVKHYRLIFK